MIFNGFSISEIRYFNRTLLNGFFPTKEIARFPLTPVYALKKINYFSYIYIIIEYSLVKRYLIFGFLTILIITLNFTFIIILSTEDKRINYEVLFLLWIIVILAAAGLAYLEKTRKRKKSTKKTTPKEKPQDQPLTTAQDAPGPSNIYKKKCVRRFKVKLAEEFNNKVEAGFFVGYILNEEFNNETVQSLYTEDDLLLGYVNKKEKRLCQNLEQLYQEPVLCWGELFWNETEKRFIARASVPILYNEREINHFRKIAQLKGELLQEEEPPDNPNSLAYLQKVEDFLLLYNSGSNLKSMALTVNAEDVLAYSNKLLKEEKWKELLTLKKCKNVIHSLPQPVRHEVKSVIDTAKEKTEK